jgi:hypothetical protein
LVVVVFDEAEDEMWLMDGWMDTVLLAFYHCTIGLGAVGQAWQEANGKGMDG